MAKKKETSNEGLEKLKADLKADKPGRLYIFHGPEAYLREYYLNMLRSKILSGPAGEFNERKFEGKDLNIAELRNAVEAFPMMAERSLVEVDDCGIYELSETDRSVLTNMFRDLPEHVCLVFVYDLLEYKPDNRIKKLTEAITENACVVEFPLQTQEALSAWAARHFREAGKQISPDLIQYMIFLTDGSMTMLLSEIRKLIGYVSDSVIQKTDVDQVVERCLTARAFDITDAIVYKKYDKALQLLDELFAMQEEPPLILGAVASNVRKMYAAHVLSGEGNPITGLMREFHISQYAAGKAVDSAKRIGRKWCEHAVCLCTETDYAMKSSGGTPENLMRDLLIRLSLEAAR